jgi:rRNA-processing protein FCF1
LLNAILLEFTQIVTTPNILTEVNSLINQIREPERQQCLQILGQAAENNLTEFYLETKNIAKVDNFTKFGLTDSCIISLSQDKYLVLTDDLKLANYLGKLGIDVINFNHLRYFG